MKGFFRYLALIALFSTLTLAAFAQDQPVSVETNLVTINVSVTDKNGNFIRGLSKNDFVVLDDGKKQDIDVFSAEDSGLSIGIVYDMHSTNDDQTLNVLDAIKRFTGRLRNNDDYFVTVFNEKGSLTTEFVPDRDQIGRHLATVDRKSPSTLYDAVFAAGDHIGKLRNPKKYLIVITEGADRYSQHSAKELKARLRGLNMPVFALTFTPDNRNSYGYLDMMRNGPRQSIGFTEASALDRSVIEEISKTSGGQAFESNIRNRVYLAGLAAKFLEEARSQYVIGFSPEANDGRWHKLNINLDRSKAKGLKITTRTGYQSKRAG
ncbi:MAG: VWA domain-containing protein [Pyrinomonadaceae bacterium]